MSPFDTDWYMHQPMGTKRPGWVINALREQMREHYGPGLRMEITPGWGNLTVCFWRDELMVQRILI